MELERLHVSLAVNFNVVSVVVVDEAESLSLREWMFFQGVYIHGYRGKWSCVVYIYR